MLITIAIPCYNSSKTLPVVVERIKNTVMSHPGCDYQIILVNDNSPDNTFEVILQLCQADKKIIGVDLSKNFGQASAQMAAIAYIKGDVAVFMDDDGQHPPEELFKLVNKVLEGYDLVYAHFANKKHSMFKRVTSKLNSMILEATNRKPKGIALSSFFALSSFSVKTLRNYKSPFPSLGGYLLQTSKRIANVEVKHYQRLEGKSNYTLKKLVLLWLQGFTNFSIVPLRFASFIGVLSAALGIIIGIILIIRKLIEPAIAMGYTSMMAAFLFIGGLIMLMLGLLGEYVGRIFILLSNTPQYLVRNIINVNESEKDPENEKENPNR